MCAHYSPNRWIYKDIAELINNRHITSYSLPFPAGLFEQFRTWLASNPVEGSGGESFRIPVIDAVSTKKWPVNIWTSTFLKMGLVFMRSHAVYSNQAITRFPVFVQLYHILFACANGAQSAVIPSHSFISPPTRRTSPYNALMEGIHQYFGDWFGTEIMNLQQDTLLGLAFDSLDHDYPPKNNKKRVNSDQRDPTLAFSEGFIQVYQVCRHLRTGLQIIDLESVAKLESSPDIQIPPLLICFPSPWMSEKARSFLHDYIKKGGFVWFVAERFPQQGVPVSTIIPDRISSNSNKKAHILKFYPYGSGGFLYSSHNPYRILKGFRYYLHQFLTTTLQFIQSRLNLHTIGGLSSLYGLSNQLLDYLNEMDWFLPLLHRSSLKSTNLVLRFLQNHRIVRKLDLSFRTEYIYRHKVDIYVFLHPKKDLLQIFLFSKQAMHTLPISLRLYLPHVNSSIRIRTHLLGQTAQLLRIQNGVLTALCYTGINPLTYVHVPLAIKVNRKTLTTNHSLDVIFLSRLLGDHTEYVFYTANGTQREEISLSGLFPDPIVLPTNGIKRFLQ